MVSNDLGLSDNAEDQLYKLSDYLVNHRVQLIKLLLPEFAKEQDSLEQQVAFAKGQRGQKRVTGSQSNLRLYTDQFFHAERIQMLVDSLSGREVGQFKQPRRTLIEQMDELIHYQERHPKFALNLMPGCKDLMTKGTPLNTEISEKLLELQQAEGIAPKRPNWLSRLLHREDKGKDSGHRRSE